MIKSFLTFFRNLGIVYHAKSYALKAELPVKTRNIRACAVHVGERDVE